MEKLACYAGWLGLLVSSRVPGWRVGSVRLVLLRFRSALAVRVLFVRSRFPVPGSRFTSSLYEDLPRAGGLVEGFHQRRVPRHRFQHGPGVNCQLLFSLMREKPYVDLLGFRAGFSLRDDVARFGQTVRQNCLGKLIESRSHVPCSDRGRHGCVKSSGG